MKGVRAFSILLAVAALIVPTEGVAQATLGFGGGVMMAKVSVEPNDDFETDSRTGIFVGASLGIPLTDVLSLSIGGNYAQKGGSFSSEFFGSQLGLDVAGDYLIVPVTLQFAVLNGARTDFSIFAGPTLGIEMKCELTLSFEGASGSGSCDDGATTNDPSGSVTISAGSIKTKSLDVGAVFGAVVSFAAGESARIFLNGGYDLGLANVLDEEDVFTSAKNRALFVGAGLVLPLGG